MWLDHWTHPGTSSLPFWVRFLTHPMCGHFCGEFSGGIGILFFWALCHWGSFLLVWEISGTPGGVFPTLPPSQPPSFLGVRSVEEFEPGRALGARGDRRRRVPEAEGPQEIRRLPAFYGCVLRLAQGAAVVIALPGPPVVPFYSFLGEWFPY